MGEEDSFRKVIFLYDLVMSILWLLRLFKMGK